MTLIYLQDANVVHIKCLVYILSHRILGFVISWIHELFKLNFDVIAIEHKPRYNELPIYCINSTSVIKLECSWPSFHKTNCLLPYSLNLPICFISLFLFNFSINCILYWFNLLVYSWTHCSCFLSKIRLLVRSWPIFLSSGTVPELKEILHITHNSHCTVMITNPFLYRFWLTSIVTIHRLWLLSNLMPHIPMLSLYYFILVFRSESHCLFYALMKKKIVTSFTCTSNFHIRLCLRFREFTYTDD